MCSIAHHNIGHDGDAFVTALHGMQTRSGVENSVRLSVKHVICDKMVESSVHILHHTKAHLA